MQAKIVYVFILSVFLGECYGSAIPVWELLKKEEKVQYVYSIFAKQVENLCETIAIDNCNQELLKYGLDKLKNMSGEDLDAVDPYQRGSKAIIWETIMGEHDLGKTTPKEPVSTTAKPNSYEDDIDDLKFGSQEDASARVENVYRLPPPKGFLLKLEKISSENNEDSAFQERFEIIPVIDDDSASIKEFLLSRVTDS